MSEQAFWQQLNSLGGLQHGWWYNGLVTPALIVSLVLLLLVVFAARHIERKFSLFLLHLAACLPLLLIVPSFYVALQPRKALAYTGLPWPHAANDFPRQATESLSMYLGILAQLGITGAVLALMFGLGSLTATASSTNVPILSTATRQITQVVRDKTQRFRRSGNTGHPQPLGSTLSSPYGRLTVLSGPHAGTQFAVRPRNMIGRKECDIVLSDAVVSKTHALLDVDEHRQTTIADQASANGLFVYRGAEGGAGEKHDLGALNGQPFALQSGDTIALGDPDHAEDGAYAVKLRFDHDDF